MPAAPSHLKAELITAIRSFFPEVTAALLWGGATRPDYSPEQRDLDVIIELPEGHRRETVLADRLKELIQAFPTVRLDPFLYLMDSAVSPRGEVEFVAPFGFYKANPFIPYMIQEQHELLFGQSLLLTRLPLLTLDQALAAMVPQLRITLRRILMDIEVEGAWAPVLAKHRAALALVARSLYSFEHQAIGSKQEAALSLARAYPQFEALANDLYLAQDLQQAPQQTANLSPELLREFVQTLDRVFTAGVKTYPAAH